MLSIVIGLCKVTVFFYELIPKLKIAYIDHEFAIIT